ISRCGSISFCASEASEKYPDKKPMGYPFDRPFKNNSYEEVRKEKTFRNFCHEEELILLIFILLNFTDVCWIK
ncbi:hypothetical protein RhiirC2_764154, partial [Rhizophagus irregularis]